MLACYLGLNGVHYENYFLVLFAKNLSLVANIGFDGIVTPDLLQPSFTRHGEANDR